jgi:ribulose-phosphate 3-epimerase
MVVTICPTVTADNPDDYRIQMERIEPFARRIHVDIADGEFAPRRLVNFDQIWWRGDRSIDLHIMYKLPTEHAEIILALSPRLVIMHAEAEGNFMGFAALLRKHGIEVGIALLPRTSVETIAPALDHIDHVLVFSGNIGYQGGSTADLDLLKKVEHIRRLKPLIEIGWDGGVNDQNAHQIAAAGVDVLNVGGFIQHATDPAAAYATLVKALA